jgi:hypothetical protein
MHKVISADSIRSATHSEKVTCHFCGTKYSQIYCHVATCRLRLGDPIHKNMSKQEQLLIIQSWTNSTATDDLRKPTNVLKQNDDVQKSDNENEVTPAVIHVS